MKYDTEGYSKRKNIAGTLMVASLVATWETDRLYFSRAGTIFPGFRKLIKTRQYRQVRLCAFPEKLNILLPFMSTR